MKSLKPSKWQIIALLILSGLFITYNNQTSVSNLANSSPFDFLAFGSLLVAYVFLTLIPSATFEGAWSSFSFLAIVMSWYLLGELAFGVMIVLGNMIVYGYEQWWNYPNKMLSPLATNIQPLTQFIAASFAWFTAHLVSQQMAIQLPITTAPIADDPIGLMLIWFVSYFVYQGAKLWLLDDFITGLSTITSIFVRDIGLGFYAIITVFAYVALGSLAFLVLLFIITFQALRFTQMRLARQALRQRLDEAYTLTKLTRSGTDFDVTTIINALYKEVGKAIVNEAFFVVLNDDDNYDFTYQFVAVDGEEVADWQAPESIHQMIHITLTQRTYLCQNLTDFVANHQTPLVNLKTIEIRFVSPDDVLSQPLHDSTPTSNNTASEYESVLMTPMQVGSSLVGVLGVLHSKPDQYQHWDIVKLQNMASQASLLIQSATLHQASLRMTNQLAQINGVMRSNLINMNKQDALDEACEIACEIANCTQSAIYLAVTETGEDEPTQFIMQAHSGIPMMNPDAPIKQLLYPEQHQKRYLHDMYPINDIATTNDVNILSLTEQINFQATLEVPLRSGYRLLGILAVYHENPHYYDHNTGNMLGMVANQVTSLLENNYMMETLESYATEQAQLVHLTRTSTQSLSLDTVISSICRSIQDIFKCEITEVVLINDKKSHAEFYHLDNTTPATADSDENSLHIDVVGLNKFPELMTLMHKNTYQMAHYTIDDHTISQELRTWLTRHQMHNVMIVPMDVDSEALGFIFIGKAAAYTYPDNTIRMLEMATNQIAAQIHNAHIHTTTNQDLRRHLTELVMIEDIIQQISQALDNTKIINNVLEAALQSTQADMALIALHLQDDVYETLILEQGNLDTPADMQKLTLGHTLIERVLKNEEVIIANDVSVVPDYLAVGTQRFQSVLAVPIMSGDHPIGVLNLESQYKNFFTEEQTSFIKGIASHAAVSIENANLLTERQDRINTLNALQQLTLDATRIMNEYEMAQLILARTINLLGGQAGVLYAYDAPTDELVPMAQGVLHDDELSNEDLSTNEAVFYESVYSKTITVIKAQTETQTLVANDVTYQTLLIIPLRQNKSISHTIGIGFQDHWQLTEQTRNTIDLLAVQVSVQLEYARLNEALRKQNDQMRTILDANRDGIILLDQFKRLQEANPAAESILGIPLSQHIQEPYQRILAGYLPSASDDDTATITSKTIKNITSQPETSAQSDTRQIITSQYELQEGMNTRYIQEVSVPVTDSDDHVIGRLLSLRDITEETLLVEYRQRLQNMLYHDLRSPLGSIISGMYLAEAIIDDPQDMSLAEAIQPTIKITLDSATYLLSLLDTLRDIPRLEKGQLPLNRKPISIRSLAEHAFATLATSMREAQLNAEIQLENLPDVNVDKEIIQRVFINLIHNAFKFTPPNGIIRVTASNENVDDVGFIHVLVCDTGPGIPETMRERIFNEFEQIENQNPVQGGKGSGLGLAFCKQAVEAHGGRIWVAKTGPLPGACFAFLLPID